MTAWSVHSYISEAVCLSQLDTAVATYSPSYYDYRTSLLQKQENSELVCDSLESEYENVSLAEVQVLGRYDFTFYHHGSADLSSLPERLEEAVTNACAEKRSLDGFKAEMNQVLARLARQLCPNAKLQQWTDEEIMEACVIQSAYDAVGGVFRNALMFYNNVQIALPGCSWPVGVRGVACAGEPLYIRTETLHGDGAGACVMSRQSCSPAFERGIEMCLTFLGNSLSELLCMCHLTKHVSDYASLLRLLRAALGVPSVVLNYFCDGSDGFEVCLDSVREEEIRESESGVKGHANLWNMRRFVVDTVRHGNNADAAHLLETKHRPEVLSACREFFSLLPRIVVALSVSLPGKGMVVSESFDSFQFLSRSKLFGSLTIQKSSPLFNHVVALGHKATLSFSKSLNCEFGVPRLRRADGSEDDVPALHDAVFAVVSAFPIGDCAVVIGSLEFTKEETEVPVLLSGQEKTVARSLSPKEFLAVPFVATVVHRTFGLVGFSGYGCSLASNFPPVLGLTAPLHYCDFPLQENAFDPNVTVYFFNGGQEVLAQKSFSEMFDALPVVLSDKDALSDSKVATRIRCRLVRLIPDKKSDSMIALVSAEAFSFCAKESVLARIY